jgi:O-antigen/teichoic acid export membrane protein
MSTVALVSLAIHGGWVLGSLVIVWLGGGIPALLGVRVAMTAAGLLAALALVHRRLQRITWAVEPRFIWRLLQASFPFVLFRVFGAIHLDIGMVVLATLRGDVMAGWLAAAQKFLRVFAFIPTAFFGAMLPAMSQSSRTSPTELLRTLTRGCKYQLLIALPLAGGVCVLAEPVVGLLFGSAYGASVPALRLLIWAIPFSFLNSTLRAALASVDRERRAGSLLVFGVLFNILANLLLIPRFGHVGVAGAVVLTEALILFLELTLLKQALPGFRLGGEAAKPLAATGVMAAFAWMSRGAGLAFTILGSAVVYVGCLLATRAIGQEEWALLNGLRRVKAANERA